MSDLLRPLPGGGFGSATGARRPTATRCQVTAEFPVELGDNPLLERLLNANRRVIRQTIARAIDVWFPHGWRDDWNARPVPIPPDGHLPDSEARALIAESMADSRVAPDLTTDPDKYVITYNVHDNVQCTGVKVPLRKKTQPGQPLERPVRITDPALPGGSGTIRPVFWLELKWEVRLPPAL